MFVKKLVEKAAKKPGGGNVEGIKACDVDPRLVFHYGIPSGAAIFAFDQAQKILAISTIDGRIKLYGKDNTQALLQSPEAVPSKFLEFIQNKGVLLNVTSKNCIEVWDVDKKLLSHVHLFKEDITSFTVMQHGSYIYVGDSAGDISVLKLDQESRQLTRMQYTIPLSVSHGNTTEVSGDTAVLHILPQPTAESKRVLIVFRDGLITLWDIRESRPVFVTGGSLLLSQFHETKKVTSAFWTCPFGSKVSVGYSNGEIFIWNIPANGNSSIELTSDNGTQSTPTFKLNLGFKVEKIPISSLKWLHGDGKASRLYIMGSSDFASTNVQVILLNEQMEMRTTKLGLLLLEPCIDMEIISSPCEQGKHKQDILVLLGKSGRVYAYDDCLIEKYLLQSQSKGSPSLPREVMAKMPFSDSRITVANFITDNAYMLSSRDEDYMQLAKSIPSVLPFDTKPKDGSNTNLPQFSGFSKVKNLYITGHSDGAVNFWDLSCPFLIPILSLKQQSDDDLSLSGVALTALYFDSNTPLLISGDQIGMVRIYKFKPEPYGTENSFMPFQGSFKKGNILQGIKIIQVNGYVLSLSISRNSGHLAVGTDKGYVALVDVQGPTILCQNHIASEISTGIISLQFETSSLHGFEKNVLVVATKDSSVLALDTDTCNMLSTNTVHPKKPSKALFMQILDGQEMSGRGSISLDSKGNPVEDVHKQSFLLICSEKAAYVYSLNHVVQGIKKVHFKKKFHSSSCCWASTFCSASGVGLVLVFCSGKVEIRSLPDLSSVSEYWIRGFAYTAPKQNSFSESSICCSRSGELVMVNADQEMFVVSLLLQKEKFRILDPLTRVYRKDLMLSQEESAYGSPVQKEKKKGMFSSVIKDMKGSKPKQVPEAETEDTRQSIEELSTIFSTTNFACQAENKNGTAKDEDDDDEFDLGLDDIDLDDPVEKRKNQNKLGGALNKQNLASKFQVFTGKIKQMKVRNEKNMKGEEKEQDEKAGSLDQIKKKYGFPSSGESSAAKMAENKLHERSRKMQGIEVKTTEMQDTAKSFSAMAREVLKFAEKDKKST